jgi:hypothetical protein
MICPSSGTAGSFFSRDSKNQILPFSREVFLFRGSKEIVLLQRVEILGKQLPAG